jgi:hypothetical protein
MAGQAGLVLQSDGFASILPERNQSANTSSAPCGDVVTAGPVAILASSFFGFVARVKEKNFPHQRLGEFFKLRGMASLANFVADVGWRRFFGGFLGRFFGGFCFRRPSRMGDAEQEQTRQ